MTDKISESNQTSDNGVRPTLAASLEEKARRESAQSERDTKEDPDGSSAELKRSSY